MRSVTPAGRNLIVLSGYDDSVARIESLTWNDVTDISASRGFDSSWQNTQRFHSTSCPLPTYSRTLPLFFLCRGEGATTHRVLALYMRWRPPRCQNKHFFLRLGGWLFNGFYFKCSLCMKSELQFLCLTFDFFRICEG